MSKLLSRLDELNNQFFENKIDSDSLLETREKLDVLDETTADSIKNPWLMASKVAFETTIS